MKGLNKLTAILLIFSMLLPMMLVASAQDENTGIVYSKTVNDNGDGTFDVDVIAYQSGVLMPLDIVMVLDVSGSMEYNVPVKVNDIDAKEDYYIEFLWRSTDNSGNEVIQGKKYKVTNTAEIGEDAVWTANIEGETVIATPIEPGTVAKEKGEYVFYTGAIDDLKNAAAGFVQDIAQSAQDNSLDHRIAVVEFSSLQKKGEYSLNTHAYSFYANILSGEKSPSTALVSATEKTEELKDIFGALKAEGPTYSDDALTQAKKIFEANSSEGRQRVVVLFTDGGPGSYGWSSKTVDLDESSIPTANAAIASANEMKSDFGAEIYTIGFFDANELDPAVDEKNKKYLAYISSNHMGASGMSDSTEPVLGGYCHINNSDSDLDTVFEKISTALGEGLDNVEIRDVVSRYFYLTDVQKKDIKDKFPNAVITEYTDGSTKISVADTQLPQIMVDENGNPVDSDDSGIFKMNYSVTRRNDFIGGDSVPADTGEAGVYGENGKKLSTGMTPKVSVAVSEHAVKNLVEIKTPSVFEGEEVRAEDFYEDTSYNWFADFAKVSYKVTDKDGNEFVSKTVTTEDGSSEFTVTATVTVGENVYTVSEKTSLSVTPDTIVGYEITGFVKKTTYFVGEDLNTEGFELSAVYQSEKKIPVQGEVSFAPQTLSKAGTQTITVTCGSVKVYFDVEVREIKTEKIELKSNPEKTDYFVGDVFDPTGIVLNVKKNNNTTEIVTEGFKYYPSQFTSPGRQTVTITYDGKTVAVSVNVKAVEAVGIEVLTLPNSTSFVYKQAPDFSGLSVKVTYNNGESKTVTSMREMTVKRVTDENVRRGTVVFSVSAEGKTATFEMKSVLLWWQWIILILLLGFIWY